MNKAAEIFISSLGLKVSGAEIETAWENSKDALPKLAQTFADMKAEQTSMSAEIVTLRREQTLLMDKVSLLVSLALTPMTEGSKRVEPVVPDCQFWTPEMENMADTVHADLQLLNGKEKSHA